MSGKKLGKWNKVLLLFAAIIGWFLQGQVAQAQNNPVAAQYVPIITTLPITFEDSSGNVTTTEVFGGSGAFVGTILFDSAGNAYFADSVKHVIWRMTAGTNIVTRIVGTYASACASGSASFTTASPTCGDGGQAGAAQLNTPTSIAFDPKGNMYINDSIDYRIRKVAAPSSNTASGWQASTISTIVGTGMWPTNASSCTPAASLYNNVTPPALPSPPQIGSLGGTGTAICGGASIAASPDGQYLYFGDKNHIEQYVFATDKVYRYFGYANGGTNSQGDGGSAGYVWSNTSPQANLSGPPALAVDSLGNVYFVDHTYETLRMISPSGIAFRVVGPTPFTTGGGINGNTGDGGQASQAEISAPEGLTIDAAGNIYLTTVPGSTQPYAGTSTTADGTGTATIRVINAQTGIISTIAGYGALNETGDGGPAAAATTRPYGIGVTPDGSKIYATDSKTNSIRVIYMNNGFPGTSVGSSYTPPTTAPASPPTTTAGQDMGINVQSAAAAPAPSAFNSVIAPSSAPITNPTQAPIASYQMNSPSNNFSLGAQTGGLLTPEWTESQKPTIASTSWLPTASWTSVTETPASLWTTTSTPCSAGVPMTPDMICASTPVTFAPTAPGLQTSRVVLTDETGANYYLGVYGIGQAPAAAFPTGMISTYATASSAGIARDAAGNLYIANPASNTVSVVSGGVSTPIAVATGLNAPTSVSLDAAGDLYIADAGNHCIREVSASGVFSTVAGTCGTAGSAGDGSPAVAGSYLAATPVNPTLNTPSGVASDANGNLYIADTKNNKIRKVTAPLNTSSGNSTARGITTFAGTETSGNADGPAASATFNNPQGVAVDAAGNVYVADTGNNEIRKISAGVVTTIAGTGQGSAGYTGDGGAASAAALSGPTAVAVDAAGNIYIADTGNNVIRLITAAGNIISTVAGAGTVDYSTTIPSTTATLSAPSGIVLDPAGNYYIADTGKGRIAVVNTAQPTVSWGTSEVPIQPNTSVSQTFTFLNTGNQPLTLYGLTFTGSTEFAQVPSGGTDCSGSGTMILAAGQSCAITVAFEPTGDGTVSGLVTITDNALNAAAATPATQTIQLNGIAATNGAPSAIAAVNGNGQTMNPLGAFSGALQVKVTDSNSHAIPSQSVTFTVVPGTATATFSNGTTSISITTDNTGVATVPALSMTAGMTQGSFTVDATVDGYPSIPAAQFAEQVAGLVVPATTITTSPSAGLTYGQTETVTVTLTAGSTGTATLAGGTVIVSDNGTVLGTLQVVSGVATVTYSPLAGSHMLTASYSGDTNFASSTSASTPGPTVSPLGVTASLSATAPTTVPYGTSLSVLTGTLTGVLSADAANVKVAFSVAATSATPDPGTYAVNATLTGSAANNYTVTVSGAPSLTITQANTTTTLTTNNVQPNLGQAVALTATVASAVSGGPAPTGTVTFYNGSTSLGAVSLSAGTAVLNLSTLPAGVLSLTASYAGSTDYVQSASTASPLTVTVVAPDFALTLGFTAATVQQGARVEVPITVTTDQAFLSGTITLSCSGPTSTTTCTLTPTSVTLGANGTANAVMTVAIAGSATVSVASNNKPSRNAGFTFAAIFLPGMLFVGVIRRRRLNGAFRTFLSLALVAIGLFGAGLVSGCGGNFNANNNVVTPPGLIAVQVTAQSGSIAHAGAVAINVVAASQQ